MNRKQHTYKHTSIHTAAHLTTERCVRVLKQTISINSLLLFVGYTRSWRHNSQTYRTA